MPLSTPIEEGDLVRLVYTNGTEIQGQARPMTHMPNSWWIAVGNYNVCFMQDNVVVRGVVDAKTVRKALPPEPPVGSIVAVTIRGELFAMQRYEQGWYCNRHRRGDGYVLINGVATGSGSSNPNSWSATPPCPNCPDTWEAMHAETSPVRVLYWKGDE